jgi:ABC-type phosphate/phosphonate transport system substrate-binding protein
MAFRKPPARQLRPLFLLFAFGLAMALAPQARGDFLRIGTSGKVSAESAKEEKGAMANLKSFIEEETGFDNEILKQKDWQEVVDKLAKGQLQIGVFQGYEFAWAQAKQPALKPLAVAINVYTYPVAYVVGGKDDAAKDFAGLQGQSLAISAKDPRFVRLFVDRQSEAQGKKASAFFSKIAEPDNNEDALDNVVDGTVKATAVDRAALEAYKERKPGRFRQLKLIARSQPFPPPVVAYYDKSLDEATLRKLRDGLLNANQKERGQTMLTLFGLTAFVNVPADFGKVLAETREAYPAKKAKAE